MTAYMIRNAAYRRAVSSDVYLSSTPPHETISDLRVYSEQRQLNNELFRARERSSHLAGQAADFHVQLNPKMPAKSSCFDDASRTQCLHHCLL